LSHTRFPCSALFTMRRFAALAAASPPMVLRRKLCGWRSLPIEKRRAETTIVSARDYCRQRPTLPHSFPCSTIGGIRLNFRVRNGNGCDPDPMTTGKLGCLGSCLRGATHKRRLARRAGRPRQCQRATTTEYSANGSFDRPRTHERRVSLVHEKRIMVKPHG